MKMMFAIVAAACLVAGCDKNGGSSSDGDADTGTAADGGSDASPDGDSGDAGQDAETDGDSGDGGEQDTSPDGDADDGGDAGEAEFLLTLIAPTCSGAGQLFASAGEEGHLLAVRLTPPRYPFTVTKIQYVLSEPNEEQCDPGFAHRAELYVSSSDVPDASPEVELVIDVPAEDEVTEERLVVHDLDPTVRLEDGDNLFVAVEMAGEADGPRVCVNAKSNESPEETANYWSNADAPPYEWANLRSFGLDVNAVVEAWGLFE